MKIPKYVQKMMDDKCRYAQKLAIVSSNLDDWLESKGMLYDVEICDAVMTGCLIYCEPDIAKDVVERHILEK